MFVTIYRITLRRHKFGKHCFNGFPLKYSVGNFIVHASLKFTIRAKHKHPAIMRSSLEYPAVEYSSIVFPYREISNKLSNFTRTWHFFSQRNIYSCDTYLPILFYSRFVLILTILKNYEKPRNSNFYIHEDF